MKTSDFNKLAEQYTTTGIYHLEQLVSKIKNISSTTIKLSNS